MNTDELLQQNLEREAAKAAINTLQSDLKRANKAIEKSITTFIAFRERNEQLERELSEAKETIEMLETRHGATMLCHEAQMKEITKQRDALAEDLWSLCRAIISEEPRDITDLFKQLGAALAATKGGSNE
jgi:septal ring factor EnvC (AmiA/AmiB activator)